MSRRILPPFCLFFVLTHAVLADEKAREIAATVNGETIAVVEAEFELRRAYGDHKLDASGQTKLVKAALDQVIDRRLVLGYLTRAGQGASREDVDLELAQLEKELKAQDLTLAEHCEKTGQTVADLRRALAWKLSWQRYLERQVTETNVERYFNKYRREFDGTQLRVAQILFQVAKDADESVVAAAKERATKLWEEIVARKVAFAEAAKEHSQAPSAPSGGDIGWIERHKPMPEDFSRVAYGLKLGEVSEPLVSPFGVHLITVLEEKLGTKTWRDAEAELRPAVALYLFRWIAEQERARAKIEYAPSKTEEH